MTGLKTMRHQSGKSLRTVAAEAGTGYSQLAKIERGVHVPNAGLLANILEAVGDEQTAARIRAALAPVTA